VILTVPLPVLDRIVLPAAERANPVCVNEVNVSVAKALRFIFRNSQSYIHPLGIIEL